MSAPAIESLEHRAEEQRRRIHMTADELREKISEAKQKLDVRKNMREHLFAVCITIGATALLIGTVIARRFNR